MKKVTLILSATLITIMLVFGCGNGMVEDRNKTPDYEIDISRGKGEFTGRLLNMELGAWNTLNFEAGNGEVIKIAISPIEPESDLNGEKVSVDFNKMKLLDSVLQSLSEGKETYKNKSFVVKWQKFIYPNNDAHAPSLNDPVIIDFQIPLVSAETVKEKTCSIAEGTYTFNCPNSNDKKSYFNEYFIQIDRDNKFKAKWEECEESGVKEGTFECVDNFILLHSNNNTDTFLLEGNKIKIYHQNPFLACVLCIEKDFKSGYYELEKINTKSNVGQNQNNGSTGKNYQTNNVLTLKEIKLSLLDAGLKKCKVLLGEPDKKGPLYMGTQDKIVWVYKNNVNDNGIIKNLVLCIRDDHKRPDYVEDVLAVGENEPAYFGIHYVLIKDGNIQSNSISFDRYSR